jgi:4-amino-4-deoxy-L-arabinose transferase-like glycosyltransferase
MDTSGIHGALRHPAPVVGILLLATALRAWWSGANQALWPDEAVYLLMAESFAGIAEYDVPAARPPLLPLFWSLLLRLGLGEPAIRFTQQIFSVVAVYLIYLLGREAYGRAVGLIASFLLSVFWMHLFYTERFMTEVPALTLWLLVLLVFWKSVVNGTRRNGVLLLGPLVVLMVLARQAYALLVPVLGAMWLLQAGVAALGRRASWASAALGLLVLLPYLVWCQLRYGSPLAPILEREAAVSAFYAAQIPERYSSGLRVYLESFPSYFDPLLMVLLLLGVLLVDVDWFRRREDGNSRRDLLVLCWIVLTLLGFGTLVGHSEGRFLLPLFPAVFFVMASGMLRLHAAVARASRVIAVALVAALLAHAGWTQLRSADALISRKANSFLIQRRIGEWLGSNSETNARVVTNGREINQYYSGRRSYWYPETLDGFRKLLARVQPAYLVVVERPGAQPDYVRPWVANRNLEVVMRWQRPSRAAVYRVAGPQPPATAPTGG